MRLYVPIGSDLLDRLRRLAIQERRRPSDQAAVIIERALRAGPPELNEGANRARPDRREAASGD